MMTNNDSAFYARPLREAGKIQIRLILGVLAIALLVWYLLGGKPPPEIPPTGDIDTPKARGMYSSTEAVPASPDDGNEAREAIHALRKQGKVDLDAAYQRAKAFHESGERANAHLMLRFAARLGHGESALMLGEMYDPAYHAARGGLLDKPDWAQAHKWYSKARTAGNTTAESRIEALRKRIERMAAEGDPEAGRLILQWK